jgi:flagellar hook-associated protein 1 FlgK
VSLDIARSIAVNSLMAAQLKISVASANISNADTKGYTVKTANQSALSVGGQGGGAVITGVTSNVDRLLMKSLMQATSVLGAADSGNSYLERLQALFGTTGSTASNESGTSLANTLASLESAISLLAATPNSAALQANTVSALDALAAQLRETSAGIQDLRSDADHDIGASVSEINVQLQTIASLNDQIRLGAASGQSTADLEDQRNTALQQVASKLNVSYFTTGNGELQVYTASGQSLVDSSAHLLSYTPASSVFPDTIYSPTPPSGFAGVMVNGVDITTEISSGQIGALIDIRDRELPAAQAQLDQLATQLADTLNAVSNQGTASPAPTSLTGTSTVTAATALSGTGLARFAVTDASGMLVSYQDLDLTTVATVGDLVAAINGMAGLSATIDSDGHLVVTSTDSSKGVAINELTSSVGSGGAGLSDWLGLNDVVSATGALDFAVRRSVLANSGLLPVSTLSAAATLTAGSQVLSAGSSTVANKLLGALTGATTFAAVGGLGSSTGSFADYAAGIVANASTKAALAASTYTAKEAAQSTYVNAMASKSGVNIDEETAQISSLQNQYAAAAQLIDIINKMFASLLAAVQSAS